MIKFHNIEKLLKAGIPVVGYLLILLINACIDDEQPEFDFPAPNTVAPTVTITAPVDTANVAEGFVISADVADGTPGLSAVTFTVSNSAGVPVLTDIQKISGTEATVNFEVLPAEIPVGDYSVTVRVEDTDGLGQEATTNFFGRPFKSVNSQMFILGSMNGWGANDPDLSMTLIADYTWALPDSVTILTTDQFQFVNTTDFSDLQWTDTDCDGVGEPPSGFGGNINCGFNGTFVVTFNDLTLEYMLEGETLFLSNQPEMYVLGSMNGWGANDPDLAMGLIDNNLWEVRGVEITAADQFKFVNTPDFSDLDWTDSGCDGVADEMGGFDNINCGFEGTVKMTFNDETFEYAVLPDFESNQNQMFILGSMNGWGANDPDYSMTLVGDNTWEVNNVILAGDGSDQFKFANTSDFSGSDWTDSDCDGVADELGVFDNINCGFSGTVKVTYNDEDFGYTVE